jgi:hypothetical protein
MAQEQVNAMSTTIKQEFVFKQDRSGKSKKSGNDYRQIELHDPSTLDNVSFFIDVNSNVNTTGLNFKDRVVAEFTMQLRFGQLQPILESLKKIG